MMPSVYVREAIDAAVKLTQISDSRQKGRDKIDESFLRVRKKPSEINIKHTYSIEQRHIQYSPE